MSQQNVGTERVGGHPQMMSAEKGGGWVTQYMTERRGVQCTAKVGTDKGDQKSQYLADIICEWPLGRQVLENILRPLDQNNPRATS